MPFGGDLGFPYVLLVVLVVFPVIGLLLRRQWRLSVARSEEIRRLLVLASEESTRAEFEAFAGYATSEATISMPVQHQCAVCFCPTTTRCARCKAVRYCSGKCQIIHWRQGHKEECQPFTATYQSNDPGGAPGAKLLRQENEIHANSLETEARQYAKSVQSIPEEPASPKSDRVNDDCELECLFDGTGKNTSLHEPEGSDEQQSANAQPVKTKTGHVKNVDQNGLSPKSAILVDSVEGLTSGKLDHLRTGCTRGDTSTTSSSGWSANGSNESSLSEPSTPSSGFWDGTVNSRRTKVDTLDDSSQSSSSDAGDADMHTSTLNLSFNLSRNDILPVDEQNSSSKIVMSDGAHSPNFGVKKHIHRAVFLEERGENVSESKGVPPLRAEKSDYVGVHPSNDSHVSKAREPGSCASTINSYPTPSYKGPSGSKHTSKSSRLRSLSPERSNHAVIDTNSTLHRVESKEVGSLSMSASTAYSSSTRTHSLQDASMLKVGSTHDTGAASDYIRDSSNARNGLKTSTHKIVDHLKVSKSSGHRQATAGSEVSKSSGHRQATAGSDVAGKYNNKGLFPYEQFVKLYNWNKIELRPCGLTNCGNSCYANAVLQCLACTPPLTAYFIQGLHSKACDKKEWCFTCEFESLILKVKEGISPLSPIRILSQIQNIGSHLGNGREEDAHEFLRYAIEKMQSVCLKEARAIAPNSLEEETTLIGLTFGGYLRSKIKCMRCGGKSERHERMMDLTVEIEGDIETLEGALRKFTGTEILDGENKYQCSRCRSYERAKKKLKVLEAPNILTIALKRFQSGKFGKLNKSIRFPEILDLAPYMSGTSDKSPIYKLYGVVVHLDVMNATFSGHYVCYVKNAHNKWFKMDDSVVTAVERENVLSKRAYMLLYARCSPRAPRSIRNLIVPPDPRKQKNPLLKLRSHSACSWDAPIDNSSNHHTGIECLYPNHSSFHPHRRTLEEDDSSSENSSSLFSEGCSCSTDSTNRDSSSTDDFFDHLFRDTDQNWNTMWKHSSDSDSSSSSSSSPSPLYTKRSPLADSERYSSGNPETSAGADRDDDGFWARSVPSLYSSTAKQCRKLGSSSSETDPDRLGWANTFANDKLGLSFRRSTRERGN